MMYISFLQGRAIMKRFLFVIPVFLLIFINACIVPGATVVTATPTWTPTLIFLPTEDTLSPAIFSQLNLAIEGLVTSEPVNELEHIAGPSYQVIGVDVLPTDRIPSTLQISVRCECAENGQCCNTARTFAATIVTLRNIYLSGNLKQEETPYATLNILEVQCFDHANLTGVASVPWTDVVAFFQNEIDGFQLWASVTQTPPQ
jgi:hypothetical protein